MPLIFAAVCPVVVRLLSLAGALPPPVLALDMDRTIIAHQAAASQDPQLAEVVLLGDSSCLMDVDPVVLTEVLGVETLGLGTLSYLSLREHAMLLDGFVRANPGRLRAVVVLQHPIALRRSMPERHHVAILEAALRGEVFREVEGLKDRVAAVLGLDAVRDRFLSHVVPIPLPDAFGVRYGFTRDLDRYLSGHKGGLIDPSVGAFTADQENRLATSLRAASRRFREAVPEGVELVIGVTPMPAGSVVGGYDEAYRELLGQWGEWMDADVTLTNLPGTVADEQFSSVTHLNEGGRARYSALVAEELRRALAAR